MDGGKAYIVVAQPNSFDIEEIKRIRNPRYKNHVVFTQTPEGVLDQVLSSPVDIVISSQYFFDSRFDLKGAYKKLTLKCIGYPENTPLTADYLAEQIYLVNPEVLVFRYGIDQECPGKIVGEINKFGGPKNLVDLLDSEDLPEILRKKDWERLRRTFSWVHFYDSLERFHQKKSLVVRPVSIIGHILIELIKSPLSFFGN